MNLSHNGEVQLPQKSQHSRNNSNENQTDQLMNISSSSRQQQQPQTNRSSRQSSTGNSPIVSNISQQIMQIQSGNHSRQQSQRSQISRKDTLYELQEEFEIEQKEQISLPKQESLSPAQTQEIFQLTNRLPISLKDIIIKALPLRKAVQKRRLELKPIFENPKEPVQHVSSLQNYAGALRKFTGDKLTKYQQWDQEFPIQISVRPDGDSFFRCAMLYHIILAVLSQNSSLMSALLIAIRDLPVLDFKIQPLDKRRKSLISSDELKACLTLFIVEQFQKRIDHITVNILDFLVDYNSEHIVDFAAVVILKNLTLYEYQQRKLSGSYKGWVQQFEKADHVNQIQSLGKEANQDEAILAAKAMSARLLVLMLYEDKQSKVISQMNQCFMAQEEFKEEMTLLCAGDHFNIIFSTNIVNLYQGFFQSFILSQDLISEFGKNGVNSHPTTKTFISPLHSKHFLADDDNDGGNVTQGYRNTQSKGSNDVKGRSSGNSKSYQQSSSDSKNQGYDVNISVETLSREDFEVFKCFPRRNRKNEEEEEDRQAGVNHMETWKQQLSLTSNLEQYSENTNNIFGNLSKRRQEKVKRQSIISIVEDSSINTIEHSDEQNKETLEGREEIAQADGEGKIDNNELNSAGAIGNDEGANSQNDEIRKKNNTISGNISSRKLAVPDDQIERKRLQTQGGFESQDSDENQSNRSRQPSMYKRRGRENLQFSQAVLNMQQNKIDSVIKKIEVYNHSGTIIDISDNSQKFSGSKAEELQKKKDRKRDKKSRSNQTGSSKSEGLSIGDNDVQAALSQMQKASGRAMNTQESEKYEENNSYKIVIRDEGESGKKQSNGGEEVGENGEIVIIENNERNDDGIKEAGDLVREENNKGFEGENQEIVENLEKNQNNLEEENISFPEKTNDQGGDENNHNSKGDDSSDDKESQKDNQNGEMDDMKAQLNQLIDYSSRCLDCDKTSSLKEEIVVKYLAEGIYLCNKCMKNKLDYLIKNAEQNLVFGNIQLYRFQIRDILSEVNDLLSAYGSHHSDEDKKEKIKKQKAPKGNKEDGDESYGDKSKQDSSDSSSSEVSSENEDTESEKSYVLILTSSSSDDERDKIVELNKRNIQKRRSQESNSSGSSKKSKTSQFKVECSGCKVLMSLPAFAYLKYKSDDFDQEKEQNLCRNCANQLYKQAEFQKYLQAIQVGNHLFSKKDIHDQLLPFVSSGMHSNGSQLSQGQQQQKLQQFSSNSCSFFCKYLDKKINFPKFKTAETKYEKSKLTVLPAVKVQIKGEDVLSHSICLHCFIRILFSPFDIDDFVDFKCQSNLFSKIFQADFLHERCIACSKTVSGGEISQVFRFQEESHFYDCFICVNCLRNEFYDYISQIENIILINKDIRIQIQQMYSSIGVSFHFTCSVVTRNALLVAFKDEPIEKIICFKCCTSENLPFLELGKDCQLGRYICFKCFLVLHFNYGKAQLIKDLKIFESAYRSYKQEILASLTRDHRCFICFASNSRSNNSNNQSPEQNKTHLLSIWVKSYAKYHYICLSCLKHAQSDSSLKNIYEIQVPNFQEKVLFSQGPHNKLNLEDLIPKMIAIEPKSQVEQNEEKSKVEITQLIPENSENTQQLNNQIIDSQANQTLSTDSAVTKQIIIKSKNNSSSSNSEFAIQSPNQPFCFKCKNPSQLSIKMPDCKCWLCIKCITEASAVDKQDFFVCPSSDCIHLHSKAQIICYLEDYISDAKAKNTAKDQNFKATRQRSNDIFTCSSCSAQRSPVIATKFKYCQCQLLCKACLKNMAATKNCPKCMINMWNISQLDVDAFEQKMRCPSCLKLLPFMKDFLQKKTYLNCPHCMFSITATP